jgi:hypothetical protein
MICLARCRAAAAAARLALVATLPTILIAESARAQAVPGGSGDILPRTRYFAGPLAGGFAMTFDGRSLTLLARYFEGVSSLGQFFITTEQFWSLELVADF